MGNNKIISDEDEKKIRAMRLGDKNAILWGLKCTGLHYRINAIACAVMYNITDDDIIDAIKELKSETYTSIGTSASGCAYAALDILGIEKYAGDSREVKRYLNCKFDFYKDFVVKAQEMKNKS